MDTRDRGEFFCACQTISRKERSFLCEFLVRSLVRRGEGAPVRNKTNVKRGQTKERIMTPKKRVQKRGVLRRIVEIRH